MLLVFPTCGGMPLVNDDVKVVRDLNRKRFNARVERMIKSGWVVSEMTSSYRKSLFGGVASYMAELRRSVGDGSGSAAR